MMNWIKYEQSFIFSIFFSLSLSLFIHRSSNAVSGGFFYVRDVYFELFSVNVFPLTNQYCIFIEIRRVTSHYGWIDIQIILAAIEWEKSNISA